MLLDLRQSTAATARSAWRRLTVLLVLLLPFEAAAGEPVRLQLKWHHQFQFAGYYAAQAQGYYQAAGLEVTFLPGQPGDNPVRQVVQGKAEFGVAATDLLYWREQGAPVVALAVIFQHSPLALMTLKRSGRQSVHDLAGRRVMIEPGASELYAYLNKAGIPLGKLTLLPHDFTVKELLAGKVDALSTYVTDEPFELHAAGHEYLLYSPREVGIDFYGDTLFTTEALLKAKPELVRQFRDASLKGWEYAIHHPEELVQLIYARYSQRHSLDHLRFEAAQMTVLLQPTVVELGYMNPGRWRSIARTYAELGLLKPDFDLNGFLYAPPPPPPSLTRLYEVIGVTVLLLAMVSALAIYIYRTNVRLRRQAAENERAKAALRQSEERSILLLNSTAEAIYGIDNQGDCTFANPACLRMLGYASLDAVLGQNMHRLIHYSYPDGRPMPIDVCKIYQAFHENRGTHVDDEVLWRADGTSFPAEYWSFPKNLNGRVYGAVVTFIDISARKQAEAYQEMGRDVLRILNQPGEMQDAIRRVLAVVKTRIGVAAVGIRLQDGDDFPYFTQDGFPTAFLQRENSLLELTADGTPVRDHDGKVRLECTCGLVISGKIPPASPLFTPGGSFWSNDALVLRDLPPAQDPRHHPRNQCMHHGYASLALIPIRNQERIVGLIHLGDRRKGCFTRETIELLEGIASHLGEAMTRKQAEAALLASEERYALTLKAVNDGIWDWDIPTGHALFSPHYYALLGYDDGEFPASYAAWRLLVHPEDLDRVEETLRLSIANGKSVTAEFRMKLKPGTWRWVAIRCQRRNESVPKPPVKSVPP